MKTLLTLLTGCLLFTCAYGGTNPKLQEMDSLVDQIESGFWTAIVLDDQDASRQILFHKILSLKTLSRNVQGEVVVANGWTNDFNLPKFSIMISSAWSDFKKPKVNIKYSFLCTSKEKYLYNHDNLDGYEEWVSSCCDKNIYKLRKIESRYSINTKGSSSLASKSTDFFVAIRELRIQMLKIEERLANK